MSEEIRKPRRPTAFRLDDERVRFDDGSLGAPLRNEARIVPSGEPEEDALLPAEPRSAPCALAAGWRAAFLASPCSPSACRWMR
ncbi:hypothetical protein [Pannonibacter phragmitetus]|uniref:hypothetical protein n=1 Tax=Pannonibacter phragmitetus TaxID=121719 RepID=UPI003D2F364F